MKKESKFRELIIYLVVLVFVIVLIIFCSIYNKSHTKEDNTVPNLNVKNITIKQEDVIEQDNKVKQNNSVEQEDNATKEETVTTNSYQRNDGQTYNVPYLDMDMDIMDMDIED